MLSAIMPNVIMLEYHSISNIMKYKNAKNYNVLLKGVIYLTRWCSDIYHNDMWHNDMWHNDTQPNDTWHFANWVNGTQHNCDTL